MATLSSVASLAKERTAWNKVMTSTYGVKLKGTNRFKRKTRTKINKRAARARKSGVRGNGANDIKSMHDNRLDLLDMNNPNDEAHNGDTNDQDDEDYAEDGSDYDDDEEDEEEGQGHATGSKRKRTSKKKVTKRKTKKCTLCLKRSCRMERTAPMVTFFICVSVILIIYSNTVIVNR